MASVVPELPDVTIYIEALERRIAGRVLNKINVPLPNVITPTLGGKTVWTNLA